MSTIDELRARIDEIATERDTVKARLQSAYDGWEQTDRMRRNVITERDELRLELEQARAQLSRLPELVQLGMMEAVDCALSGKKAMPDPAAIVAEWQASVPGVTPELGDGWLPIETAPRDGTAVLLKLKDIENLPECMDRFAGICFAGMNWGNRMEWTFAAPVGCGGFPDDFMAGWMPLPDSTPMPRLSGSGPDEGESEGEFGRAVEEL